MSNIVDESQSGVVDLSEKLSKRLSDDKTADETPTIDEKCYRNTSAQSPAGSGRADSFDDKEEFLEANTSFERDDETLNDNSNQHEKHVDVMPNDAIETSGPHHKEATWQPGSLTQLDDATVDPKYSKQARISENLHAYSTITAKSAKLAAADQLSDKVLKLLIEKSDINTKEGDEKANKNKKNEAKTIDELSNDLKHSQLSNNYNSRSSEENQVEKQDQSTDLKNTKVCENDANTNDHNNENENANTVNKRENSDNDDNENMDEDNIDDDECPDDNDEGPDDDEIKTSPAYIPRGGRFYMHDLRVNDRAGGGSSSGCLADDESVIESVDVQSGCETNAGSGIKSGTVANASPAVDPASRARPGRADRKWEHDLYDDRLQRPKTAKELVRYYGRDIRKGEPVGESENPMPKLKANVPPDSNDDKESMVSNFEDEDDDSETAPEFKPQARRTRPTGQRRRVSLQTGGGGVAEGRRRTAPTVGGRRQISADGSGAPARDAKRTEYDYESRHPQDSTSRSLYAPHQKRVGGGPTGFGGLGYRRTITSTRYSINSATGNGGRRPTPRISRDNYSAVNETTDGTNGGDVPSPPRQYSSRGKRYTAQRHGNAPPVNFVAASSSASAQQTQKYHNAQPKNIAQNPPTVNELLQPYHQTQPRYNTTQYLRGRGHPLQNNTLGGYNGHHANGRGQQQQHQQQQRYSNQQYHQLNSSGPGSNYHNQLPPNFVQANSYIENYPPLGSQSASINYQQPAIIYMPATNQRLRQPTDTVYYDTTQQQRQRGTHNNGGHTVSQSASSLDSQPREKRRLQIAAPGK